MAPSELKSEKPSVLFVCLGNICRSPMAEAVFLNVLEKRKLRDSFGKIDSAGTGAYHAGDSSDPRTIDVCKKHGIKVTSKARKIKEEDFELFDYIFGMDEENLYSLHRRSPENCKKKLKKFGSYDDKKSIDDPYYGGSRGFDNAYEQCLRYSNAFLGAVLPDSSSSDKNLKKLNSLQQ